MKIEYRLAKNGLGEYVIQSRKYLTETERQEGLLAGYFIDENKWQAEIILSTDLTGAHERLEDFRREERFRRNLMEHERLRNTIVEVIDD